MSKTQTTPYDSAEYLKTEEDIAAYFEACLEEAGDDAAFLAKALGTIARARGMTQLAKEHRPGTREPLQGAVRAGQSQLCHYFEGDARPGPAAGSAADGAAGLRGVVLGASNWLPGIFLAPAWRSVLQCKT
ncbi:hypothetical protein POHY109586_19280 [Polaromonas hydrogenivorans]